MSKIRLDRTAQGKLLEAERLLMDVQPEFDEAERCGIDCQNIREVHRQALEDIQNMKRYYMPSQQQ